MRLRARAAVADAVLARVEERLPSSSAKRVPCRRGTVVPGDPPGIPGGERHPARGRGHPRRARTIGLRGAHPLRTVAGNGDRGGGGVGRRRHVPRSEHAPVPGSLKARPALMVELWRRLPGPMSDLFYWIRGCMRCGRNSSRAGRSRRSSRCPTCRRRRGLAGDPVWSIHRFHRGEVPEAARIEEALRRERLADPGAAAGQCASGDCAEAVRLVLAAGRCRPSRPSCAESFPERPPRRSIPPSSQRASTTMRRWKRCAGRRSARPRRADGHLAGAVGPPLLRALPSFREPRDLAILESALDRSWFEQAASRLREIPPFPARGGQRGRPVPVRLPLRRHDQPHDRPEGGRGPGSSV